MRDRAWRVLLCIAVAAFVVDALAIVAGNQALARFSGTVAWLAGLTGAITGLIVGAGRTDRVSS